MSDTIYAIRKNSSFIKVNGMIQAYLEKPNYILKMNLQINPNKSQKDGRIWRNRTYSFQFFSSQGEPLPNTLKINGWEFSHFMISTDIYNDEHARITITDRNRNSEYFDKIRYDNFVKYLSLFNFLSSLDSWEEAKAEYESTKKILEYLNISNAVFSKLNNISSILNDFGGFKGESLEIINTCILGLENLEQELNKKYSIIHKQIQKFSDSKK